MKDERVVQRLIDTVQKIRRYTKDVGYEQFAHDEMLAEACVFNLAQLGEDAHKVSDEVVATHPEIAWNELYGLRNRLVHDYQGVNLKLVWEIIEEDLPALESQLEDIF